MQDVSGVILDQNTTTSKHWQHGCNVDGSRSNWKAGLVAGVTFWQSDTHAQQTHTTNAQQTQAKNKQNKRFWLVRHTNEHQTFPIRQQSPFLGACAIFWPTRLISVPDKLSGLRLYFFVSHQSTGYTQTHTRHMDLCLFSFPPPSPRTPAASPLPPPPLLPTSINNTAPSCLPSLIPTRLPTVSFHHLSWKFLEEARRKRERERRGREREEGEEDRERVCVCERKGGEGEVEERQRELASRMASGNEEQVVRDSL